MKWTAMAGAVVPASAGACDFTSYRSDADDRVSFSCELSASCCRPLQDIMDSPGRPIVRTNLVGICSRADQVELYNCAVENTPKLYSPAEVGKISAMKQANLCHSLQKSAGTDGSGHCSFNRKLFHFNRKLFGNGKGTFEVDDVSTGCCEAVGNFFTASQDGQMVSIWGGEAQRLVQKEPQWHNAQCGMIGACGKEDQKSMMRIMMNRPAELELLEMFNMTDEAPWQMLATILTSGAEDEVVEDEADVTEDDATEATIETIAANLKIKLASAGVMLPALVGFAAGASVVGLGAALMRRKADPLEEPLVA